MAAQSDEALVEAAREGRREAYDQLVRRYASRVFGLCYGILGNAQDAEDVAQESLVHGYERLASLRKGTQFPGWIRRIARNRCVDFLRKSKRASELPTDLADPHQQISHDGIDLRDAIEELPEALRTPLLLYYFQGHDANDIAETIGVSNATVHTRLSRARKQLHRMLTEEKEAVK